MKTLATLLLIALLVFSCQQWSRYDLHKKQIQTASRSIGLMLTRLSNDWSFEVIQNALEQASMKGKEEQYREMLARTASLGKWKHTCGEIEKDAVGPGWEPRKITLTAKCQFENGQAKVTVIGHKGPKLVDFHIEKYY